MTYHELIRAFSVFPIDAIIGIRIDNDNQLSMYNANDPDGPTVTVTYDEDAR